MQRIKSLRLGQPGLTLFPPGLEGLGELGTVTPSGLYVPTGLEASGEAGIAVAQIIVGGGAHPNEPFGYTQVTNRPFAAVTEDGWTGAPDGQLSIVTESGFADPTTVAQINFPNNFGPGVGPVNLEKAHVAREGVYYHYTVKYDPLWYNEASGTKLCFLEASNTGLASKPMFMFLAGSGQSATGALTMQVRLQGCPPNLGGNDFSGAQNVTVQGVTRGIVYDVEVQAVMNTPGAADGILRVWVNGASKKNLNTMSYRGPSGTLSDSAKFDNAKIAPTYGGTTNPTPYSQNIWMGDMYVSVSAT